MATDSGMPPLSATKNYVLKIQDLNDNAPIFEKFKYSVRISEYLQPGTVILTLKAFDLDSGPFGSIRYFLSTDNTPYWSGDGHRKELEKSSNFGHTTNEYFPFEIGSVDGKINVTRKLDRETTGFYTFTVKAVDNYSGLKNNDSHEAFATVEIFIADENDNIPQFDVGTPKILSLTEKNKAGMHIFTFHATDSDDQSTGNGQVTYKILSIHSSRNSSAKIKELFAIDQTTGYLRLNKDLTQLFGVYELLIEASDSGTPKRLANKWTLKIDVQDVNDNPPQILFPTKGSSFFIPEFHGLSFGKMMVFTVWISVNRNIPTDRLLTT
uniref:Cadherin domain-containing protein n=1 Tax=Romanomermis culicivorax TaxID=13658 RepID=A0A915HU23_ROMCU